MTPRDLYINLPAVLATEREHSRPNSLRIAGKEKIWMGKYIAAQNQPFHF